jgi:hypothetical protein
LDRWVGLTLTVKITIVGHTVVNMLPGRDRPLTKTELLNGLNIVLNNFLYGCVCPNLVPPELWRAVSLQTAVFKSGKGDVEIKLGPLVKRARNADYTAAEGFKRNYENSLLRAMMREAHELILLYCRETGQFPIYEAQPWFQFARVLRNVMSHAEGGTLRRWPKGITSVTWREKTFDATMLGQRLVFYPPDGLELLKDQIEFVSEKLS